MGWFSDLFSGGSSSSQKDKTSNTSSSAATKTASSSASKPTNKQTSSSPLAPLTSPSPVASTDTSTKWTSAFADKDDNTPATGSVSPPPVENNEPIAPSPDYMSQWMEFDKARKVQRDQRDAAMRTRMGNAQSLIDRVNGLNILNGWDNWSDQGGGQFADLLGELDGFNWGDTRTATGDGTTSFASLLSSGVDALMDGTSIATMDRGLANWAADMGYDTGALASLIDQGEIDALQSSFTGARSRMDSLLAERQAQEAAIRTAMGSLNSGLTPLQSSLEYMGIGDTAQMQNLDGQLALLNDQRNQFNMGVADQLGAFNQFDQGYSALNTGLSDLRDARAAELQRISDFEQSLYDQADAMSGQLDGLTIADIDQLTELQNSLRGVQRNAGRFSSELGFDLSQEMGQWGVGGVADRLSDMFTQRDAEIARNDAARADFTTRARGLNDLTTGLSMYNLDNLNTADGNLSDLQSDLAGYSSVLGFDAGAGVTDKINSATDRLSGLRADRAAALADINQSLNDPLAGINDIALYDDTALQGRASSLSDIQNQLGMFNGGTDDIAARLTGGQEQVQARLAELATKRNELETSAQTLLERLNNTSYYQSAGLDADRAAVQQERDQIELYKATQAMDELSAMEARLNSERNRLTEDEGTTAARKAAARQAVYDSMGSNGVPQFSNAYSNPFMAALMQYYNNAQNDDDELMAPVNVSAFSAALGV